MYRLKKILIVAALFSGAVLADGHPAYLGAFTSQIDQLHTSGSLVCIQSGDARLVFDPSRVSLLEQGRSYTGTEALNLLYRPPEQVVDLVAQCWPPSAWVVVRTFSGGSYQPDTRAYDIVDGKLIRSGIIAAGTECGATVFRRSAITGYEHRNLLGSTTRASVCHEIK